MHCTLRKSLLLLGILKLRDNAVTSCFEPLWDDMSNQYDAESASYYIELVGEPNKRI